MKKPKELQPKKKKYQKDKDSKNIVMESQYIKPHARDQPNKELEKSC